MFHHVPTWLETYRETRLVRVFLFLHVHTCLDTYQHFRGTLRGTIQFDNFRTPKRGCDG